MLPAKIAFVDLETTGTRASADRIIEVGILRVENNKLVKTYKTLINPQTYIPKEITMITGLRAEDLENAPTFRAVKDEIYEILDGCTFVAHNVRFDYGFLKSEFSREMMTYAAKHFCTVRLSRLLFPHWQRHNLDSVIQNFEIECESRHRAFDDAKVLFDFYLKLQQTMPSDDLEKAINKAMKKPSLPVNLQADMLDRLPESPGVYIFYGDQETDTTPLPFEKNTTNGKTQTVSLAAVPLYVGKSINIKNRVLSHFQADLTSASEMKIAQQIKHIETIQTIGELGALLLESQMIKELLPLYNKRSRIKHELIALKTKKDKNGYETATLEPITHIDQTTLSEFKGFFRSRKQAKAFLADIARDYSLCEKLLGLEKTQSGCFGYRLGRCNGACVGKEESLAYNLRFMTALSDVEIIPWPYEGEIAIEETDTLGNKDYFIINNWCYKGKVSVDVEGNKKEDIEATVRFDLDVYKILRQFLKKSSLRYKVRDLRRTRTEIT